MEDNMDYIAMSKIAFTRKVSIQNYACPLLIAIHAFRMTHLLLN